MTTALDIVKAKIDAKYEPIKNEIAGLKDYLALNNDDLTESEKNSASGNYSRKARFIKFPATERPY